MSYSHWISHLLYLGHSSELPLTITHIGEQRQAHTAPSSILWPQMVMHEQQYDCLTQRLLLIFFMQNWEHESWYAFNSLHPSYSNWVGIRVRKSKTSEWLRGSDGWHNSQTLVPLGLLLSFILLFSFHHGADSFLCTQALHPTPPLISGDVLHHMTISLVWRRGMFPSLTLR